MAFGIHIFRRFILFSKSCIGQFLTVLWSVHGLCVWLVCEQFLGSSEAGLWLSLWPYCDLFLQPMYGLFVVLTCWTVC